jgi:hypothetical protein
VFLTSLFPGLGLKRRRASIGEIGNENPRRVTDRLGCDVGHEVILKMQTLVF